MDTCALYISLVAKAIHMILSKYVIFLLNDEREEVIWNFEPVFFVRIAPTFYLFVH